MSYFNPVLQSHHQSPSNFESPERFIAPVTTLALPASRRGIISNLWNSSVAFFTTSRTGKAIGSKTYLIARQMTGEMIGQAFIGFFDIESYALGLGIAAAFANDSKLRALGISKTLFVTSFAVSLLAMERLSSKYFEEPEGVITNYLSKVIGGLIGQMVVTYMTDPPKIPLKESAKKYLMSYGCSTLMQCLFPSPGISGLVRDSIAFQILYNKETITNVYSKTSSIIKILIDEDIAKLAQITLVQNSKMNFFGSSLLISQIPRFIRVGIPSFNQYTALTQGSPQIIQAQELFRRTLLSSNPDLIELAKNTLIASIKKEMKKHFMLIGIANSVTGPVFDHFFASKLDSLDIIKLEENILGFTITDHANAAYSKELLKIHTKSFLAFASIHFSNKDPLPKEVEILFLKNLVHLFMNHYNRVVPNSRMIEYTTAALDAILDEGLLYVRPRINRGINRALQENLPPPSVSEPRRSVLHSFFAFITSIFLTLYRSLYSVFSFTPSLSQARVTQIPSNPIEESHFIEGRITEIPDDDDEEPFVDAPETVDDEELFVDAAETVDDEELFVDAAETVDDEELFVDAPETVDAM